MRGNRMAIHNGRNGTDKWDKQMDKDIKRYNKMKRLGIKEKTINIWDNKDSDYFYMPIKIGKRENFKEWLMENWKDISKGRYSFYKPYPIPYGERRRTKRK